MAATGPLDLATLYRLHADTVAIWVGRLGGPELDVEDCVHEVFLVAQRRLGEWRGDAKITTWLYEIAFRVVQDRRRWWRWSPWRARRADAHGGEGPDDLGRLAADEPDALTLLERREANAALYRILERVGEKYRVVIVLFELEGLSGEQIATLTGTSLANVWVRLHRARQKMLKLFLAWEEKERS